MQIAFSYTCIVPLSDGENQKSFQVQRRLRIETIRTDIGRQAIELYNAADSEVTMSLLCHKIIKAIADEGVAEARMLLQDWLVILTAKYNQHMMRRTGMPMDTSFSKFDNLKMVPKFVYGMLRGKMMDVLVSLAGLGSGFACGIRVGGDEGCACMQRENEKERGEERSYTDIMTMTWKSAPCFLTFGHFRSGHRETKERLSPTYAHR